MPIYEVIPLKGVPPVFFGMTRGEIRSVMPGPVTSFKKGPYSTTLADAYYQDRSFQIFFDDQDQAEYIELSQSDDFVAMYRSKLVFGTKADDLVTIIAQDAAYDPDDRELGYSYVFPSLELSVWRPVLPDSEDDMEGQYFSTIGIGRQGYYSRCV